MPAWNPRDSLRARSRCIAAARMLALGLLTLVTTGPFLWLLSTSLKGPGEDLHAFPPQLLPQHPTAEHYARILQTQPLLQYLANSAAVALLAVTSNLLLSCLAAYPLARMPFKGRSLLFGALLATLMVPFQLLLIPVYQLALALGLHNTTLGLALPHLCSAFGIFFMRQAFQAVPAALEEVALLEGVGRLRIWWHVWLPLVRPSLAALAIFSFVAVWGDFLWPLIITDDPAQFTLPLGVNRLASSFSMDWRLVAAGVVFSLLPVLVVFTLGQRHFIEGALRGAVKG